MSSNKINAISLNKDFDFEVTVLGRENELLRRTPSKVNSTFAGSIPTLEKSKVLHNITSDMIQSSIKQRLAEDNQNSMERAENEFDLPKQISMQSDLPRNIYSDSINNNFNKVISGRDANSVSINFSKESLCTSSINNVIFLQNVILMWAGVEETDLFVYNEHLECYQLRNTVCSSSQENAFTMFCEVGRLARQIYLGLQQEQNELSFMQQSLRSAVRNQFSQYHLLIATLREQSTEMLTYGKMLMLQKKIHAKLCVMSDLLKITFQVKGGELVSRLHEFMEQGSTRLLALINDIYLEAIGPLLYMTMCSLTQGEVCDPFHEFFITIHEKIDDEADNFWSAKYSLNYNMLPTTVNAEVAEEILLVMKNIGFIRRSCRANQWRMEKSIVVEAQNATFATLPLVAHKALLYSNSAVLRLIKDECKLEDLLHIVNAFLLVGYGDFYELLINKLEPLLSRLSHTIQVSYVRDQLNATLAQVSPLAKHVNTDYFDSLQCELVKDESKLGWDAFIITLSICSPLNNLFDFTSMKVYRRLFRMMFRVKVAEVTLKNAWRKSVTVDRIMQRAGERKVDFSAWRDVVNDAHSLGLQLNHCIVNLWSYLVSEVCSVAWDLLLKAVKHCTSFDDIRLAHNVYLAYLTQRCLLHNDCASIRMNIENILTIARQYCNSQALLNSLIDRGAGNVTSIKRQYQNMTDDYHREISSLLTVLEEQHV